MRKNKKKKKKQPNRFIIFISTSSQMGITIFLGAYLGKLLDAEYQTDKAWFTITLTLLALIVSLYSVLKTLNRLNGDDK